MVEEEMGRGGQTLQQRITDAIKAIVAVELHSDQAVDILTDCADALDAKDAEIARVRAETLEEAAAMVEEQFAYDLAPCERGIASAIRALAKGEE